MIKTEAAGRNFAIPKSKFFRALIILVAGVVLIALLDAVPGSLLSSGSRRGPEITIDITDQSKIISFDPGRAELQGPVAAYKINMIAGKGDCYYVYNDGSELIYRPLVGKVEYSVLVSHAQTQIYKVVCQPTIGRGTTHQSFQVDVVAPPVTTISALKN